MEEPIEHFLFEWPAYRDVRTKYEERLVECCEKFDVWNVVRKWQSKE